MPQHKKINYTEFPASNLPAVKAFFTKTFGWSFTDYGRDYTAFAAAQAGLDGGFYRSDRRATTATGSALIVFFSDDLEQTQRTVEAAGGAIIKPTFDFPGGRRFHFADPNGNEWAVWSDKVAQ
jgi:hypothetical protein